MPSSEVMDKWKHGRLRSSSGEKVKNRKQAIAIMLSEKRNEAKHGGHYEEGKTSVHRMIEKRDKGKKK